MTKQRIENNFFSLKGFKPLRFLMSVRSYFNKSHQRELRENLKNTGLHNFRKVGNFFLIPHQWKSKSTKSEIFFILDKKTVHQKSFYLCMNDLSMLAKTFTLFSIFFLYIINFIKLTDIVMVILIRIHIKVTIFVVFRSDQRTISK